MREKVIFIVIEGIDACGKTTQVELLLRKMQAHYLKFPNAGSPTGKLIYAHLEEKWHARVLDASLEGKGPEINALAFQCLQFTNRLESAMEILEFQQKEENIITDRYTASAVAYGSADGLDMGYLIDVQRYLPQPDLNILIDISLETSLERRPERRDRYEAGNKFVERVMANYLQFWARMMEEENDRWLIINGERTTKEVHEDIFGAVEERLTRLH